MASRQIMALDYGDVRVGVALADENIKIAIPYGTIDNSDQLLAEILKLVLDNNIVKIVIGYPRNQSGEPTAQTANIFLKSFRRFLTVK